jgi:hypothetical protein
MGKTKHARENGLMESVLETASGLRRLGFISEVELGEFEDLARPIFGEPRHAKTTRRENEGDE